MKLFFLIFSQLCLLKDIVYKNTFLSTVLFVHVYVTFFAMKKILQKSWLSVSVEKKRKRSISNKEINFPKTEIDFMIYANTLNRFYWGCNWFHDYEEISEIDFNMSEIG